ncbi:hypothetical protein E8E12_007284 [Didymella heteroderae]|uniref:LicD/FKTN/FKRP nucleotidyltransferase domain-containing protein n=1 Tax=Didymella heteroderae TaxID=1769908 RepID=A0A9P5C1X1_9PLEO|nr:hypothetical protein E8E12_007284 [Didymella heteroderae]
MKLPLELLLLSSSILCAPLVPRSASFSQLAGLTSNAKDLSTTDSRFPQKYFHESIYHPHYDGRFASAVLPRKIRLFHMRLLLRSYTLAMKRARVRTWVMHGSLLGWWWNRGVFPWDSDLDFCVEEEGMWELGAWWNMTVHEFSAVDLGLDLGLGDGMDVWDSKVRGGGSANEDFGVMDRIEQPEGLKTGTWDKILDEGKKYLLEVNPHFVDSSTGDTHNRIDARWIDTSTGLFIDVTTVHPVPSDATTEVERSKHKFFLDQSDAQTRRLQDPEEMYTKDTHLYTTASLFPLRESKFEGTPVFVPYAYEQLLIEEYGPRALTETWFNGYKFDEETKKWDVAEAPDSGKGRGDREDAAGRFRKGGKKPKWKPVDDKERNRKDNVGDKVYTPKPGTADDVHVVPGGAV